MKSKKNKSPGKAVIESVTDGPIMTKSAGTGESAHLRSLQPLPDTIDNPVEWADKHLEKLVPLAAKEKEWQLKFGNDAARDKVASELLAMRSISAKRDTGINVAAVINLVPFQNPWAKETKALDDGKTVDGQIVTKSEDKDSQ